MNGVPCSPLLQHCPSRSASRSFESCATPTAAPAWFSQVGTDTNILNFFLIFFILFNFFHVSPLSTPTPTPASNKINKLNPNIGGGSFGFWHWGVVKALLDEGLLPRVVSGSSAGAIGCAVLATRTDRELLDTIGRFRVVDDIDDFAFFGERRGLLGTLRFIFTKGRLYDHDDLVVRLQRLLGPTLTFQEAYHRSGRILNISVTAADTLEPPRLLNYLTAPHVVVWSAVACSSAFPGLYLPQDLLVKDQRGNVTR
jgi:hypothetical protein